MKCLETRRRDGMKWRRYRTADDRIVTTYELPTEVLLGVTTMKRVHARLEAYKRGQARAERRAQAQALLRKGWKPVAVANEVGMTTRNVEMMRNAL